MVVNFYWVVLWWKIAFEPRAKGFCKTPLSTLVAKYRYVLLRSNSKGWWQFYWFVIVMAIPREYPVAFYFCFASSNGSSTTLFLQSFTMFSVSYDLSAITYVWKNDEATLRKSPSLTTLNAYLIKNQTIPCPTKASWRGQSTSVSVSRLLLFMRSFSSLELCFTLLYIVLYRLRFLTFKSVLYGLINRLLVLFYYRFKL